MSTHESRRPKTRAHVFIRRECGLLLGEVAKRAGLGRTAFDAIVNGNRTPKIDEAHAVVLALREMTGREVVLEDLWPINSLSGAGI